jgi:squalene synthase HpnC
MRGSTASDSAIVSSECSQLLMISASELRSGKTHRDENFPVASWIIHPRHRRLILAFYNFVRTADDVADHDSLGQTEKLRYLDLLEAELLGKGDTQPEAIRLRNALSERSMPPRHALDVLTAFRMDVSKLRYRDWDDLMGYCTYSAMPVGRYVLDVHGEDRATWPANDALCAALQINNHLQDCGKDYRNLNRVYLPRDALAAAGASVEELARERASPQLLRCLHSLAARTQTLLDESRSLSTDVRDFRLGLEISVIQAFADKIVVLLKARDPLSERVHLGPIDLLAHSLAGLASEMARRASGRRSASKPAAGA